MLTEEVTVVSKTDQLISDEDQSILIQIRDNIRYNYFAIGDIANKYVVLGNQGRQVVLAQDVYDSVGKLVGKSGRTVRYYAEQAAFYHPTVRDQYDILPFSFFVFARSMGGSWEAILEYAMRKPNISLAALRHKFLYEPDGFGEDLPDEMEADFDLPAAVDYETKDGDERTMGLFLSVMVDLASRALAMAKDMPIPPEAQQKLYTAANQIREVLQTIT